MLSIMCIRAALCAMVLASSAASAEPGLVGYWKFDEAKGATVADASGNGNTGTLTDMGDDAWVAGRIDGALAFDGKDDAVTVPDAKSLELSERMTIALWIQPSSWGDNPQRIVAKGSTRAGRYLFAVASGGALGLDSSSDLATQPGVVKLGQWQHVAVTSDGSMVRFYVDGAQVSSIPVKLKLGPSDEPLYIGNRHGADRPFAGSIDDVRIYDRPLSGAEISKLVKAAPKRPPPKP